MQWSKRRVTFSSLLSFFLLHFHILLSFLHHLSLSFTFSLLCPVFYILLLLPFSPLLPHPSFSSSYRPLFHLFISSSLFLLPLLPLLLSFFFSCSSSPPHPSFHTPSPVLIFLISSALPPSPRFSSSVSCSPALLHLTSSPLHLYSFLLFLLLSPPLFLYLVLITFEVSSSSPPALSGSHPPLLLHEHSPAVASFLDACSPLFPWKLTLVPVDS